MSVWDLFTEFWSNHGKQTDREPIWWTPIPVAGIANADLADRAGIEAVPGRHYVHITAKRMNLRTDEFLNRSRYPVLHSQVAFDTNGGSRLTIPSVAGEASINGANLGAGGNAVMDSIPLVRGVPFHEGQIEMVAGLVSMKGEALLDRLAGVVSTVTQLVPGAMAAGTTVSTGITVANAAIDTVEQLFGATETRVMVGMHAMFGTDVGTPLRSGLYALVNPRTHETSGFNLDKPENLMWVDDELAYNNNPDVVKLRAQDWIVLEVSLDEHRSYTAYPDLVELVRSALSGLVRDVKDARLLLNTALITASMSAQIVEEDRNVVYAEIRKRWEDAASAIGVEVAPGPASAEEMESLGRRGAAPSTHSVNAYLV